MRQIDLERILRDRRDEVERLNLVEKCKEIAVKCGQKVSKDDVPHKYFVFVDAFSDLRLEYVCSINNSRNSAHTKTDALAVTLGDQRVFDVAALSSENVPGYLILREQKDQPKNLELIAYIPGAWVAKIEKMYDSFTELVDEKTALEGKDRFDLVMPADGKISVFDYEKQVDERKQEIMQENLIARCREIATAFGEKEETNNSRLYTFKEMVDDCHQLRILYNQLTHGTGHRESSVEVRLWNETLFFAMTDMQGRECIPLLIEVTSDKMEFVVNKYKRQAALDWREKISELHKKLNAEVPAGELMKYASKFGITIAP